MKEYLAEENEKIRNEFRNLLVEDRKKLKMELLNVFTEIIENKLSAFDSTFSIRPNSKAKQTYN